MTVLWQGVVETAPMNGKDNDGIGKRDVLDARRIDASVVPVRADQQRYLRKDDGVRGALRVLLAARDHMTSERTATINALVALLRVLNLGIDARKPLSDKQIPEVAAMRRSRTEVVEVHGSGLVSETGWCTRETGAVDS